jgi:calcineurin-like phosphoesterase family protein
MKEGLIARHNERVSAEDRVWHLGDMFWKSCSIDDAIDIMKRLKGSHYYVFGNHEELMMSSCRLRSMFMTLEERMFVKLIGGPKHGLVLDHYAGDVWRSSNRGSWQLYGHSHGGLDNSPKRVGSLSCDVGVDSWDCYPVSLEQIAEVMRVKKENRDADNGSDGVHREICTV